MDWRFTLIDRISTQWPIAEPVGWDSVRSTLKRDKDKHGLFYEYSVSSFEFIGLGRDLIYKEYKQYGLQGEMYVLIEYYRQGHWNFFFKGKLVFSNFDGAHSALSTAKIGIEQVGEVMDLINRMDQKVDLKATKAFDKITDLPAYEFLGKEISLPSKAILLKTAATNSTALKSPNLKDDPQWDTFSSIVPGFQNIQSTDIPDSSINDSFGLVKLTSGDFPFDADMVPIVDLKALSTVNCSGTEYSFKCRYKGKIEIEKADGYPIGQLGKLYLIKSPASAPTSYEYIFNETLWNTVGSAIVYFDVSKDITVDLAVGDRLWYVIYRQGDFNHVASMYITEDPETFVSIETYSICDPTPAKLFMINEAGSRIIESISNRRLDMYSEYFGRTNSQPYSFAVNGDGSLAALTKGLLIRRAKKADGTDPDMILSLKDWFDNSNAIHNIGMGMEQISTNTGQFSRDLNSDFNLGLNNPFRVRVEPWKFFYQDNVIMRLENIDEITTTCKADEHVAIFKYGYNKWEAEEYNGLDEFLTKREARTQLTQVKNILDKTCSFIASGYAWEVTRRKGPDSKDWRFDNELFIICLEPDGTSYRVELGKVTTPVNIFDPATIYNYRISPARNLMRWMSRLLASYKTLDADSKLLFSNGEGNYISSGELDSLFAKLEAGPIAENADLSLANFTDQAAAAPLVELERDSFEYPLTIAQYHLIQQNPYGKIEYSNEYKSARGWIDTIDYGPIDGKAKFVMIPEKES